MDTKFVNIIFEITLANVLETQKTIVDYIQQEEGLSEDEAMERFNKNKQINGKYTFGEKLKEQLNQFGGQIKPI